MMKNANSIAFRCVFAISFVIGLILLLRFFEMTPAKGGENKLMAAVPKSVGINEAKRQVASGNLGGSPSHTQSKKAAVASTPAISPLRPLERSISALGQETFGPYHLLASTPAPSGLYRIRLTNKWQTINVPANYRIGIRTSLPKIFVKRDGKGADILFRRPKAQPQLNEGFTEKVAGLSPGPDTFWFPKGPRQYTMKVISRIEGDVDEGDVEILTSE